MTATSSITSFQSVTHSLHHVVGIQLTHSTLIGKYSAEQSLKGDHSFPEGRKQAVDRDCGAVDSQEHGATTRERVRRRKVKQTQRKDSEHHQKACP